MHCFVTLIAFRGTTPQRGVVGTKTAPCFRPPEKVAPLNVGEGEDPGARAFPRKRCNKTSHFVTLQAYHRCDARGMIYGGSIASA